MKEKLHYILLLITVLLVAGISLANMQSVNVSFILFSFKLPLIILILKRNKGYLKKGQARCILPCAACFFR